MSDVKSDSKNQWTDRLPTVDQVRRCAAAGEIPLVWIAVTLVAFFPLGMYFVWKHSGWPTKTKGIWTGAWAVSFVLGMWLIAPLLIFVTLLGAFGVAFCVIWSSSSLAHDKKKLATGLAVGGLLACLFAEFAFFSIRAYNAEHEQLRQENARDKEKARQKEETIRQKLTEGNQAWASGDKAKAVVLYRECIELGLSQGSDASAVYQRVIEQDVSTGNMSSAKALMRKAHGWNTIELAFTDPKCNELLKEVEAQIAEEKRVDDETRAASVGNTKTLLVGKWAHGTPSAVQVDEFTADGRYILSFNGAVATTSTYKFINTDTIEIKSNPTFTLKISIAGDELTETDAKGKKTLFRRVADGVDKDKREGKSGVTKFNPRLDTRSELKNKLTEGAKGKGYIGGSNFVVIWDHTKHAELIGEPDSTTSLSGSKQLWGFKCSDGSIIFQVVIAGREILYEKIESERKR